MKFKPLLCTLLFVLALPLGGQEKKAPPVQRGRGYVPPTPEVRAKLHAESHVRHGSRLALLAKFQDLPRKFDCRDKGWVLPVGDQGNCGSCYLYSTIYGTLTQAFVKAGYGKPDGSFVMSVQFGMECHNFGGCGGGNGTEVIEWVRQNGWPAEKWVDVDGTAHNDYPPYEARSRTCREKAGTKRWKIAEWGFASASPSRAATTAEIKTSLYNFGSLNVSLDAGGQFGNGTDTITALGGSIDHEIELVAWDDDKDGGAFLLKNQWDTSWGNGGYRWVTYKAAARLADVFFVSVSPLPPPPGPPDPPGPAGAPVITSPASANAVIGTPFSFQLAATNSPLMFAAFNLPGGLTCSTTGLIAGAPTTGGPAVATVLAVNKAGAGMQALTITVTATPLQPVTLTLTPEQVAAVLAQANAIAVTEDVTLRQLGEMMAQKKAGQVVGSSYSIGVPEDRVSKMENDIRELKRATDAILKAMLSDKEPPK